MAPAFLTPLHTPRRVWAARIIALVVDAIEVGAFPFFIQGVFSPVNDVLDVATAAAMVALLGWHWAFLPTLVAEMIPGVGLIPTWTAAVLIATRGAGLTGVTELVDPPALPPPSPPKSPAERPNER